MLKWAVVWCAAGFAGTSRAGPVELNLNVDALGQRTALRGGGDVAAQQVGLISGGRAAFAFTTRSQNITNDPDGDIRWGYPVRETADNPWVMDNGEFSGRSEFGDHVHAHDLILPNMRAPGERYYGPHPHLQLYIFKQTDSTSDLKLIGCSDLKHTFATDAMAGPEVHFLRAPTDVFANDGESDAYSNNSNMDRDFLGPIREMDFDSFQVPNHSHFGGDDDGNFFGTENGFHVWNRGHGEKEHTGDDFDHRLQTRVIELLPPDQGGVNPAGTRWFFATSYFLFDPGANEGLGGREVPLTDNTAYRQFLPNWDGTQFNPAWVTTEIDDGSQQASVRHAGGGQFLHIDMSGLFQEPVDYPSCVIPAAAGDMDGDGDVDFDDIAAFVLGLIEPDAYQQTFGVPPELRGDIDADGDLDFDDIDDFVSILNAPQSAPPLGAPEPSTLALLCAAAVVATVLFKGQPIA